MADLMAEINEDKNGLLRRSDMTLRDWFAGQALAGWMASRSRPHTLAEDDASWVYTIADAMLAARNNTSNTNSK